MNRTPIAAASEVVPSLYGHAWIRLTTAEALDGEGAAMSHCIGNGDYDDLADVPMSHGGVWSLRSPSGKSVVTCLIKARNFDIPDGAVEENVRLRLEEEKVSLSDLCSFDKISVFHDAIVEIHSKMNPTETFVKQSVERFNRPLSRESLRHMHVLRDFYEAMGAPFSLEYSP